MASVHALVMSRSNISHTPFVEGGSVRMHGDSQFELGQAWPWVLGQACHGVLGQAQLSRDVGQGEGYQHMT